MDLLMIPFYNDTFLHTMPLVLTIPSCGSRRPEHRDALVGCTGALQRPFNLLYLHMIVTFKLFSACPTHGYYQHNMLI